MTHGRLVHVVLLVCRFIVQRVPQVRVQMLMLSKLMQPGAALLEGLGLGILAPAVAVGGVSPKHMLMLHVVLLGPPVCVCV